MTTDDQRPLADVFRRNVLAELARRDIEPVDYMMRRFDMGRVSAYRRVGATKRRKRAETSEDRVAFTAHELDVIAADLGISTDVLTSRNPLGSESAPTG